VDGPRRDWLRLVPLWLGLSAVRSALTRLLEQPQIWTDELTYWQIARSLHRSGTIVFHEKTYDTPAVLFSLLISPLFSIADPEVVFGLARVIGSIALCAVVFPAYGLARELVDDTAARRVALLAALVPGGVYTATLMPETVFYPLVTLFVWLSVRLLDRGRGRDAVLASATGLLTFFAKPHFLFAAVAHGGTACLWGAAEWRRGRRAGLARAIALRLAPTAALALLYPIRLLVRADTVRPRLKGIVLGTYAEAGDAPPATLLTVLAVALALTLTVSFATGIAGLAAALTSAGTRDARRLTATLGLLLVAVSVFVVARSTLRLDEHPRLHERYLFIVAPLLLASQAAASYAPAARERVRLALAAGLGTGVLLLVRFSGIALTDNAPSDSPSLTAFLDVSRRHGFLAALVAVALAAGLFVAAGHLARPRPRLAFGLTAALFVLMNAGWYGFLHRPGNDVRGKTFALSVARSLPAGSRVAVVTDGLELHVLWALETWLPGPLVLYSLEAQAKEWWIGDSGDAARLATVHRPTHVVHAAGLAGAEAWGPVVLAGSDLPTPAVVRQNPSSR